MVMAAKPMQIRDRLIQETEGLPEPMITELLNFLQFLKVRSSQNLTPMSNADCLTAKIDYLETVLGIQKGLASFDRREGIAAIEAVNDLRQQFDIPLPPKHQKTELITLLQSWIDEDEEEEHVTGTALL
jgi:hypothetical protein